MPLLLSSGVRKTFLHTAYVLLTCLNIMDHIHSDLMASTLELRVQPLGYDHLRKLLSHDSCTEAQDVGIVVLSVKLSTVGLNCAVNTDSITHVDYHGDVVSRC